MAESWSLGQKYERPRHKGLKVLVILCTLMAITILPALAAKGGGKGHGGSGGGTTTGGGTISLHLLNGDTQAIFAHQVTFDVSATFSQPWVHLNCYKNGTWVSGEWGGFWDGSANDRIFNLGPTSLWSGGDADCTADLVEWTARGTLEVRQSTSFHAYG